jgi:hypothetical protein
LLRLRARASQPDRYSTTIKSDGVMASFCIQLIGSSPKDGGCDLKSSGIAAAE